MNQNAFITTYMLFAFFCKHAQIAQLVEQGTENPCVVGSIPTLGTTISIKFYLFQWHPEPLVE
jgi:hypothetical protein